MKHVLVTGARAPAALTIARLFAARGWRVWVADSLRFPVARFSNAVEGFLRLPSPVQQPQAFHTALCEQVRARHIDWVVPTCEELFHVSMARPALEHDCRVLAEPLDRLRALHHKGLFAARACQGGLPVPQTQIVTDLTMLQQALVHIPDCVVKPAFSRFATEALLLPEDAAKAAKVRPTPQRPWVVQARVRGAHWSSYGAAWNGRLTAHVAYRAEFTLKGGTTVAFRATEHAGVRDWVARFAAAERWTGQLAFDFIEDERARLWAIECNPRATSGVHLFGPELIDALTGTAPDTITPPAGAAAMLLLPMLGCGWARGRAGFSDWWRAWRSSPDAVWARGDALPGWLQGLPLLELSLRGLRRGVSPTQAATLDIEWNGP